MSDDIPPLDPSPTANNRSADYELLELRLLQMEAENQDLKRREYGQRRTIRWIAVFTGIFVIGGMGAVLTHLVHSTFWGPFHFASGAFSVAMIVAPIASITAITVALFVGAFRKFDEKDLETLGNGATGVYNTFRGN